MMATEQSHDVIRNGIGQRLRSYFYRERELPPRISALVAVLDHAELSRSAKGLGTPPQAGPSDNSIGEHKKVSVCGPEPQEELRRYSDKRAVDQLDRSSAFPSDNHDPSRQAGALAPPSAKLQAHKPSSPSANSQLNTYLDRLLRKLPGWLTRTVKWLRQPERIIARLIVSLLLVVGGIFAFLPVLGVWMIPLGLIIISQDLPFLQRPLVCSIKWMERKWNAIRDRVRNRGSSKN